MRVAFFTHGCRLNQSETDALEEAARLRGHEIVSSSLAKPDVLVLNSCTITREADVDAKKWVRRMQSQHPDAEIVVTGCYATRATEEVGRLPGVQQVLPGERKYELLDWLERGSVATSLGPLLPAERLLRRGRRSPGPERPAAAVSPRRARGLLKVQDGCDYRCSFCIVPFVRGASRSVPVAEVVRQALAMEAGGMAEIVLTGAHLGTYGRDLSPRQDFVGLIETLVGELTTAQVRVSSLDPHEVSPRLLEVMASRPERICRHLHLPAQSGHPATLRRMRRAHTVEAFEALVRRACDRIPGLAVGSDVIVGFPGETEAEFRRTYELFESLPLSYLHVFSYSPREGTAAYGWADDVAAEVKAERSRRLRLLSEQMASRFRSALREKVVNVVLLHGEHAQGGRRAMTDNFVSLSVHDVPPARQGKALVRVDDTGLGSSFVA